MSYDLLVDQCATEPDLLLDDDDTCGSSFLANRSDTYNKYIGNDNDTATQASSGYAESTISDTPSLLLDKDSSFALNSSGDIVTIPSMAHLALNARYTYCVDGNPCFPTKFSREHFLPEEPENLSTEMESGDPPAPILTRSEREREDALRMCNMTVSRRGPQKQHRCLWQLAKFMVCPITQVQDLVKGNDSKFKDGQGQRQTPIISPSKTFDTATTQRSVKTKRSWLPVSCSSSFCHKSSDNSSTTIRLFALWSRATTCKACSYIPLDEEIQSGWDVIHNKLDISSSIVCPRSAGMIDPLIGYQEISVDELLESDNDTGWNSSHGTAHEPQTTDLDVSGVTQDADSFDTLPPQLETSIRDGHVTPSGATEPTGQSGFVTYLSPHKLRLMLEDLVAEYGEEVILDRDCLRVVHPEAFFNLWWYSARFSLPLPLAVTSWLSSSDEEGNTDSTASEVTEEQHIDQKPGNITTMAEMSDCCAFASWDKSVALHGCRSATKAITAARSLPYVSSDQRRLLREKLFDNPYTDIPLLSFFNLQSYAQGDWDHPDFSESE